MRTLPSITWTALACLTWAGCHKEQPPFSAPAQSAGRVRVQRVERRIETAFEQIVGTVEAGTKATLQAKLTGRIAEITADPGQAVRQGDLLVRLEAQEWRARYEQAVAARDQVGGDLKRYRELVQRQAVTQAEFDALAARFQISDAAAKEAQTLLSYTEIKAPFDGLVARKWVEPGDLATPGRSLLEVEDPGSLQLHAAVPESLTPQMTLGLTCAVHVATLPEPITGKAVEISPSGDPNSRTFLVKFELPAELGLRSGQFGRVSVPSGSHASLRVPVQAVRRQGQLEFVFVVTNQIAQLRLVKTGRQIGGEVELLSGVDPAEAVVIEGGAGLVDGQPVKEDGENALP